MSQKGDWLQANCPQVTCWPGLWEASWTGQLPHQANRQVLGGHRSGSFPGILCRVRKAVHTGQAQRDLLAPFCTVLLRPGGGREPRSCPPHVHVQYWVLNPHLPAARTL